MEHKIILTISELEAIQDRSYYAGFATGHEIGRQNESFTLSVEANKRERMVLDTITGNFIKDCVPSEK